MKLIGFIQKNFLSGYRYLIMIGLISVIFLFYHLGEGSLADFDEAHYAQVSVELLSSDNWLDLHFNGDYWPVKPPLYFWVTAIVYKINGINEFSARFIPAVSNVLLVLILSVFIKRKYKS